MQKFHRLFSILVFIGVLGYCFSCGTGEVSETPELKCILFDFDGTIADSFDAACTVCNLLAVEYGVNPIPKDHLKRMSMSEIVTKYLKIPWYKLIFILPSLHQRAIELMAPHIETLPPIDGMQGALQSLKKQGFMLGIVSSTKKEYIEQFLRKNNLELFDVIHAGSSIFGKHHVLNQFLQDHKLDPKEVLYVGDEVRDIEAAQNSAIPMVAVNWGFNTHEKLKEQQPEYLIAHPTELLTIVQQLVPMQSALQIF